MVISKETANGCEYITLKCLFLLVEIVCYCYYFCYYFGLVVSGVKGLSSLRWIIGQNWFLFNRFFYITIQNFYTNSFSAA